MTMEAGWEVQLQAFLQYDPGRGYLGMKRGLSRSYAIGGKLLGARSAMDLLTMFRYIQKHVAWSHGRLALDRQQMTGNR